MTVRRRRRPALTGFLVIIVPQEVYAAIAPPYKVSLVPNHLPKRGIGQAEFRSTINRQES